MIWTEASVLNHKFKSRSRAKKEVMKKAKERESKRIQHASGGREQTKEIM